MAEAPWLSIVGLGENGRDGLSAAACAVLDDADIVFGGPRHLELTDVGSRGTLWTVPFSVEPVLACRDKRVVVLASGDPFWFGVGGSLTQHLLRDDYQVFPAHSTFSLCASALGWRLEDTTCLGLHAQPLEQLREHLKPKARLLVLVRDGEAPRSLAEFLVEHGAGASRLWVMEAVGGPRERIRETTAAEFTLRDVKAPVAVALEVVGSPSKLRPRSNGLPDDMFVHEGQITKRPVRALTLSTLSPRDGEVLWDIGAGSGSISVEWLLAGASCRAVAVEPRQDRRFHIEENARRFGVASRLSLIAGQAPEALAELPAPDAVFLGGGASEEVIEQIWRVIDTGVRLVANAVTLETEALLTRMCGQHGGELLKIEISEPQQIGRKHAWRSAYPVVQWSVVR